METEKWMDSERNKKDRENVWPTRTGHDWSEIMKDATPEDLARALLRPVKKESKPEEKEHHNK